MRGKVLFVKKNAKGIFGFIGCDDGDSYYFDTSCIIKGNFIKPNIYVEFDVLPSRDGKTQAINVKVVPTNVAYGVLDQEKIEELMAILNEVFLEKNFVDCTKLPELFEKASVNYKDYAENIKSFVDKYLYTVYTVKKPYYYEDKTLPMALVPNKTIDTDMVKNIIQRFTEIIESYGFVTAEKIPVVLKELGIDNYRDFSGTMDLFVERFCDGLFVPKKRIKINGKVYPKIYVHRENVDLYQEEDEVLSCSFETLVLEQDSVLTIKSTLLEYFAENEYVKGGIVPEFFKKAGVYDYKKYAKNLETFIELYFSDTFEMKKNEIRNGKCEPSILVLKNSNVSTESLHKLYQDGDCRRFLSSTRLANATPLTLGIEGIQMALYMLADYLGKTRDVVNINAFHEILFSTGVASDLKQYKDNEELLELGAQTSYLSLSTEDFSKVFANIHNGKRNLNNNWNGIIERFWTAKNTLAIYLTCLIMIITKKDTGVDNYIDEAFKDHKIDKLPIILKVYTDFIKNGNNNISLRLKKKIIGHCFDCHDINTLCVAYQYFDDNTITEMSDVISFLNGELIIDKDVIMSWFHSDIGEMIAEKITNYYWWKESRNTLSDVLIKTFSSILWDYSDNYFSAIIYNDSCPDFTKEQKERILIDNFINVCDFTREYKKAFLFASYIYFKIVVFLENAELDATWIELREWMEKQIKNQLSSELSSACVIRLFRYDDTIRELESYYCDNYVAESIKNISTEDELDNYINQCEELNLPFIIQWVVNNSEKSSVKDKERHIRSLIETRRFEDSIMFVQSEHSFSENQKIKFIKEIINTNFDLYSFRNEAYQIFDHSIPEKIAEQILLHNISFVDAAAIQSLICIYLHRKDWAKAMYLYIPFRAIHEDIRGQFIADFYRVALAERILDKKNTIESHYDVVKCALKVYDPNEFESFIEWAKKIKVPSTSRKYSCKPKTFDNTIKEMLGASDYNDAWHQLLFTALRTDNNEKQDSLRFCIIISFIGRYGLDEFEKTVRRVSQNKYSSKNYTEYYISLWKGLLTGRYCANFLRLCRRLIGNAPLTFWNIFYDVSVCKNHVFSATDFELKHWIGIEHEMQSFYDEVLNQYNITRETVYIKIAASIISEFQGDIIPSFECYGPYCNSNRNKDFLFSALIKMVAEGRYINEILKFLKDDIWRCEEEETQLIHILQSLCTNEYEGLLEERLKFNLDELCSLKSDFLECAKNYPRVAMPKHVRENSCEYRLAYQYKLVEWLLRIGADRGKVDGHSRALASIIPIISDAVRDNPDYLCYLQFISVMYKTQLGLGSEDIVYIRNRYYRLLISSVLMELDIYQFDDDDIVLLMRRNKHFASVYPEYKEFKKSVLDFVKLDCIPDKLKDVFLVGVISNNWEQFTKVGSAYSDTALRLINVIESYTNYRDLNCQILKEFIYDGLPTEIENVEYVSLCSPTMYFVLKEIKRIYDEDENNFALCRELLVGIAYLDDPDKPRKAYDNMSYYLKNHYEALNKYWNMYVSALLSTSYVKTIINILAQEIRKHRIPVADVIRWRPVFVTIKELSVFYYLLSLKYAIERKLNDSRQALKEIPSLDELPIEWIEEKTRLEAYLAGEVKYFNPGEGTAIATLSVEKEAINVSFIQYISQRHSNSPNTLENSGVNAYKAILQGENDMEDISKYNLYKQLFAYVKSADDLYEIYRQIDSQGQNKRRSRLTYNELVIEYGSLTIVYNEQIFPEQKMDILIEIFDIYQLLNDINKAKTNIINRLICAEQSVLETPGVRFEKWLSCKNNIHQILQHEVIAYPEMDVKRWLKPIEECLNIVNDNDTEMAILDALSQWRNSYNLLSDCPNYENAFVRSVDEKVQNLRNGVNLSLTINNKCIEDDSIFYQVKNVSPYNNVSISLKNSSKDSACLQVMISINNGDFERFDGRFSNELDLRANDICGQSYRLPQKVVEALNTGDVLEVILNIVYDGRIICNNSLDERNFKYENYDGILTSDLISNAVHYGTAVPAFSATIKGFGREKEKMDLRDLLEENLAIIYGPSRAGKSSLLNYLANDYIREYADFSGDSSFMCIRVADEQNTKNDYIQDMLTGENIQRFENSTQIMEYLFLSPLKIAFSESSEIKKLRMCKIIGDSMPDAARKEICSVLYQKGDVVEKYGVISQILCNYHCQLWLMFDEFQQIVEKWVGNADELAELCTAIKYNQTSIKLVLCGSDELVRIFECSQDSCWDEFKVKTAGTLVFVGQLSDADFGAMMNDRSVWRNVSEKYPWNFVDGESGLPAVLQSLYEYTGGNAICGKLFGEEILKKLKKGDFSRRKHLYPSDITHIAYDVLNSEVSQVKNLLITHTTKNLQAERPYLLFIAHELASDINLSNVSFRKICEFFATKESTEIETALKLLVARGILKTTQGTRKYSFATLYYFDCYKNQATDLVIGKLKSMMSVPVAKESEETLQPNIMDIMQLYDALTPQEKYRILSMVYADDALPEKAMEEFKKRIANNYRDVIETQNNNNIMFNAPIQLINTAFTSLIGSGSTNERLEAFRTLPKLEAFYTDQERERMKELQAAKPVITDDETAEYELSDSDVVVIDEIDEINTKAQNRYYGEMVSTMLKQSDSAPNSSVFAEPTDEELKVVLGIKKTSQLTAIKALPQEYYRQLCFAVALHKMILPEANETIDYSDVDFSPISIMYCKLVEIMLKDNHLKLYGKALSELTITSGESFSTLNKPEVLKQKWKDITLGTFVWHLIFQKVQITNEGVHNKSYFKPHNDPQKDKMPNLKRLSDYTGTDMDDWKKHAKALAEVVEIRNSSAHGGNAVSKPVFEHLLKVLFSDGEGELVRIWELYQN